MQIFRNLDDFPQSLRGGAVSIGNFDGVHLGHARLVERLRAMAQSVGGPSVVFTFDPPPTRILRPRGRARAAGVDRAKNRNPGRVGRRCPDALSHRTRPFSNSKPGNSSTKSSAPGLAPGRWSRAPTSSSATTAPATWKCCVRSAPRPPCPTRWPSRSKSAGRSSPARESAIWC